MSTIWMRYLCVYFFLISFVVPILPTNAQDGTIRIETRLVDIGVDVTDDHGVEASDLTADNFDVYEDDIKKKIEFFSDADAEIELIVCADISGSMKAIITQQQRYVKQQKQKTEKDQKFGQAKLALSALMDRTMEGDEFGLVTFSRKAVAWTFDEKGEQEFTNDPRLISNALMMVQPEGRTAFYDGVQKAIEQAIKGRNKKKAYVVVISDGQDNASRATVREIKNLIKEANVTVYSIGIHEGLSTGTQIPNSVIGRYSPSEDDALVLGGMAILKEIAEVSGGEAFFPETQEELEEFYAQISLKMRHQYRVGFMSENHDGRWHKIEIKFKPTRNAAGKVIGLDHLKVRSRREYFAPKS